MQERTVYTTQKGEEKKRVYLPRQRVMCLFTAQSSREHLKLVSLTNQARYGTSAKKKKDVKAAATTLTVEQT